jgi:hypothetical protein
MTFGIRAVIFSVCLAFAAAANAQLAETDIGAESRPAAEALCSRLRAAGENCLVQHD